MIERTFSATIYDYVICDEYEYYQRNQIILYYVNWNFCQFKFLFLMAIYFHTIPVLLEGKAID